MILSLFRRDPRRQAIAALYERAATASRAPGLYLALGVPDTVEGRFESLSLHVILVLRTLRSLPSPAEEVATGLAEAYFRDLDAILRESGVGDTKVAKRMKPLAEAFYGRGKAFDPLLDASDEAGLTDALGRNVTGGAPSSGLARYVLAADRALGSQDLDSLVGSGPRFPEPETFAGQGTEGGTP